MDTSKNGTKPRPSLNNAVSPVGTDASLAGRENIVYGEDENEDRGNWTGRLDFLLACIGYAVGLGNVWRFPYLCYRNGGGAFLIPYTLMLLLAGLPLFFMELSFGQYASLGPLTIWKVSPMFKGVGFGMLVVSGLVCIYYNIILTYIIFYFFASINTALPWAKCGNAWNNNATCFDDSGTNNMSDLNYINKTIRTTPSEEYWKNYVLEMTDGIDDLGTINWKLCLCLLLAWIIVFLCLAKGVKSTGKVVYFTATFPYVVLAILMVRGATLPGSLEGVKFYIIPDFKKLGDAKVWGDAAVQIFYSLGPAWGGLITMSSYNRFHNNCYRDALIVAFTNCGTSVFAGFAIFSMIGFMAGELGVPVSDVTDSGPGLAFVAYPAGLARMPAAPFWSVLFFFMLITLGLDSMFALLETVISALVDEFPDQLRSRKTLFTGIVSIIGFLLGLPQVTQGGFYIMHLMDWYCASFSLLIVALVEVIAIMWVYGYKKFLVDVHTMLGFTPGWYWRICWLGLTPAILLFIIIFNAVNYTKVSLPGYVFPDWAEMLGMLMQAFALIFLPGVMIYKWLKYTKWGKAAGETIKLPWTGEAWRELSKHSQDWGPALDKHRTLREQIEIELHGSRKDVEQARGIDNPALESDKPDISPPVNDSAM